MYCRKSGKLTTPERSKSYRLVLNRLLLIVATLSFAVTAVAEHQCGQPQRVFPIQTGRMFGFIDRNGKVVVQPVYDHTDLFSGGFAVAYFEGKPAYVNGAGVMPFRIDAEHIQKFTEGLAAVRIRGKWGFIDVQGRMRINPIYDSARPFSEGVAAVWSNGEWLYIDRFGRDALRLQAKGHTRGSSASFHDGRAQLESSKGKFGYVDHHGSWAVPPMFDNVQDFSEGVAAVEIDHRWGFIDRAGNFLVPTRFPWVSPFHEGLAAVATAESDGSVGFIRKDGLFLIPPRFDYARPFCRGLSAVALGKRFGYVDKRGELVVQPEFEEAFSFMGDLAPVMIPGSYSAYIDKKGNVVWVSEQLSNGHY